VSIRVHIIRTRIDAVAAMVSDWPLAASFSFISFLQLLLCHGCSMHGRAHSWAEALSTFPLLLIKTLRVSCCSFRACMCTSFSSHLQDFMRQT
jgi:hypothetical protein